MDGNLAMNSHEDNMSEKDSQDAYQEFIIKERFPINDEWDDIDKIYAKGQRDGARWMDSYLTDFADKKKAELLLMKKDIAFKAWKAAANAFRLYPNNKHTFFDYWSVEEKGGPTENNYYPGISHQTTVSIFLPHAPHRFFNRLDVPAFSIRL